MLLNRKAFTLVEMLVALAVSSIVIIATYASYDMVKTQYEKNIDIADMHTSGRAIMCMIERDVRMAGYEHRTSSGNKTFSTGISEQLVLSESDNACCDSISVIYDHSIGATSGVERRRITYSVREFPGLETVDYELLDSDTTRYRLYKKNDVLGRDGVILSIEEIGTEQVLADFVEDLQFENGQAVAISDDPREKMFQWRLEDGGNGSWYEHVDAHPSFGGSGSRITWTIARDLAEARTFRGITGHLATLTSSAEINFICDEWDREVDYWSDPWGSVYGDPQKWIGGYQTDKTDEPGGNWTWITGEPLSGSFPWSSGGYPRDTRGTADYLKIELHNSPCGFRDMWNESEVTVGRGYIVEYDAEEEDVNALINIKLTLRSKNKRYSENKAYTKEANEEHHVGNYNFEFNDKYKRDVFFSTVAVRNMLL